MYERSRLIVGAALLLQSCSYAISPDVAHIADRTISFEKLQASTSAFKDKTVILGGRIIQIKNTRAGTLIEVSEKELDYWDRPRRTDRSGGRFIVLQQRYLDPMVFAPGREITVAGVVAGTEEASLDGSGGVQVLLHALEIKLWPHEKPGWNKPTFLDPLYDPSTPQGKYGY